MTFRDDWINNEPPARSRSFAKQRADPLFPDDDFSDISEEPDPWDPEAETIQRLGESINHGHLPTQPLSALDDGDVEDIAQPTPLVELFETKTELKKKFNPEDVGVYFDQSSAPEEFKRRMVRLDKEHAPEFEQRQPKEPGAFREPTAVEQRRHGVSPELLKE